MKKKSHASQAKNPGDNKKIRISGTRWWKNNIWVLVFCLTVSTLVSWAYFDSLKRQSVRNIEKVSAVYAERTENLINLIFHKTDVLAAVVKLENGNITENTFNDIAGIVYEKDSGIRGIQYMPGAVVTYSYPLRGNEAVIGKNFLQIPERKKDVELAINTKSIALSGPYHLLQGGLGVVARNPVFLTDEDGEEYFWGFSAIVLDLPDAIEPAGLDGLYDAGYRYQLFCINENNERIVIAGDKKLKSGNAICRAITVPHHEWTLVLTERYPWVNYIRTCVLELVGIFLSLILWRMHCIMMQKNMAIRAKNRFFSDISHDMRTPLNAVIGFSMLARNPGVSAAQKDEYLDQINSAGRLMLDLVNDTLTISKAESGKLQLQLKPVSTSELGRTILSPIQELAQQKGVTLIIDKAGYRPRTVMADQLNLQKIFLNILNNAVKFTPQGGTVTVRIWDEANESGDPELAVSISDTGVGISPEFMPHLFEPFAQERRKGYENTGTGLGLTIVKQIVELMGGRITAESREGEGTTFKVYLRLQETAQRSEEKAIPAKEGAEVNPEVLKGRKILVCEDNRMNREIAETLLQNLGMETVMAENGQEGVQRFAESMPGEYTAVLMDIRMPVMDGYEAARQIRKMNREDAMRVPIIAMSADVYAEDISRCAQAGMNGHIAKPVDPRRLTAELVAWIQK